MDEKARAVVHHILNLSPIPITIRQILSPSRQHHLSIPRQIIWYILYHSHHYTIRQIAAIFFRDVATVHYGLHNIKNLLSVKAPILNPFIETLKQD